MIADINKDISESNLISFADDMRIYTKIHELNIINPSSEVLDLGVYMSSNCAFDFHVSCVYKRCSNLSGWIIRTFSTRETRTMMTIFKSLVLSRQDYGSQLWSPIY